MEKDLIVYRIVLRIASISIIRSDMAYVNNSEFDQSQILLPLINNIYKNK
jgi:hypothetical protein